MASATDAPLASPGLANGSLEEQIAYYKSQYESLEAELQDFQQCSREVESELERDIEQSEKRERQLKERLEERGFEVDEWKVSCAVCTRAARPRCSPPFGDRQGSQELTSITGKVQAGQDGSQWGAECPAEGNHDAARAKSRHDAQAARH